MNNYPVPYRDTYPQKPRRLYNRYRVHCWFGPTQMFPKGIRVWLDCEAMNEKDAINYVRGLGAIYLKRHYVWMMTNQIVHVMVMDVTEGCDESNDWKPL